MYATEKAEAEVITRGLAAISHPRLEIDVVLETSLAGRQLDDCAYDVLFVSIEDPAQVPEFVASASDSLPVVFVGGAPGEVKSNGVLRVPLPLSYTLLEQTLRCALALPEPLDRSAGGRRRDQVG